MPALALTAHGFSGLQDAEALVLDWLETEGLELVHGQDGVLIGWSEASLPPGTSGPALAAEVRFYDLGNGWLQARWTLQPAGQDPDLRHWAEALLRSLRQRLECEPHWQIDSP